MEKFMYGGTTGYYQHNFSDKEFKIIDVDKVYNQVIDNGVYIVELSKVVYHPQLFKKYPEIKKLSIHFRGLEDDGSGDSYFGTTYKQNVYWHSIIEINLYIDFYKKNKKEKYGKESEYPERSAEAILLHEIQHVCQLCDGRKTGLGRDEVFNEIRERNMAGSGERTDEEIQDLATLYYKSQHGEQEAMKTVRTWLESRGLKYGAYQYIFDVFEKGGKVDKSDGALLNGPSHKEGGIDAIVGNNNIISLEGGEAIINKKSTAMFLEELSKINVAGGGVPLVDVSKPKFETGGVIVKKKQHTKVYQAIGDRNKSYGKAMYLTDTLWAAQMTSHEDMDRIGVGHVRAMDILDSVKILDIENEKLNIYKVKELLPEKMCESALSYQLNNYHSLLSLVKRYSDFENIQEEPNKYLTTKLGYDGIKFKDYKWDDQDYWPEEIIGDDYKKGGVPTTYVIFNNTNKILINNESKDKKVHLKKDEEA